MPKEIQDMTDEEIGALSPEELAELTAGIDLSSIDGNGEGEGDGGEDGADAGASGEEDELTEEALAELLAGQEQGEDTQKAVAYARFKEKVDEANDLRLMLHAALSGREQGQQQAPPLPQPPQPPEDPGIDVRSMRLKLFKLQSTGTEEEIEEAANALADAEQKVLDYRASLAEFNAKQAATRELETDRILSVTRQAEAEYPFLDPKSDTFDEAASLAVNAKARQLIAEKRMRGSDALREAVDTIGKRFAKILGVPQGKPASATTVTTTGKKKVDPRVIDALKRAGLIKHPSAGSGHGMRTAGVEMDISKLPDKDLPKPGTPEYDRLIGKV